MFFEGLNYLLGQNFQFLMILDPDNEEDLDWPPGIMPPEL